MGNEANKKERFKSQPQVQRQKQPTHAINSQNFFEIFHEQEIKNPQKEKQQNLKKLVYNQKIYIASIPALDKNNQKIEMGKQQIGKNAPIKQKHIDYVRRRSKHKSEQKRNQKQKKQSKAVQKINLIDHENKQLQKKKLKAAKDKLNGQKLKINASQRFSDLFQQKQINVEVKKQQKQSKQSKARILNNAFKKLQKPLQKHEKKEEKKTIEKKEEKEIIVSKMDDPEQFMCPITQEIMKNPVMIIVCGHSFEEKSIIQWLAKCQMCPICKKPCKKKDLQKNFGLKAVIEKYMK